MKPHQRKNPRGKLEKGGDERDDPNLPIFFYMPKELPYGLFCQWEETRFIVPTATLDWLRTAHPMHNEASPPTCTFRPEGEALEFNCAEQFMMCCKALYFNDQNAWNLIRETTDPSVQKKHGRSISEFVDYLWLESCERVAFEGNWFKFAPNEARRNILLGTGERMICEASSMDRRWGIGYKSHHAMRYRGNWGDNLLGKAIMQVRAKLRERILLMQENGRVGGDWELPVMDSEVKGV